MDQRELDRYFRSFLDIDRLSRADDSVNGLQVSRANPEISRIAFAVDASMETFRRARDARADALFVHHGLFWNNGERIDGSMRERIKFLLDSDIALYACHLPLDMHPEVGNNACLSRILGITSPSPFGNYHGLSIGFSGTLEKPLTIPEIVSCLLPEGETPLSVLPFGPTPAKTAAVVSGGAAMEAFNAFGKGIDVFVTGEISHTIYNYALEEKLSVIAAGHYATETHGVKAVAEKLSAEKGLSTFFIDVPTSL